MNLMSRGSFSEDHQCSEEDAATQQDTTQQDHQMRGVQVGMIEREHMFDKVVTPSDVGKLNRLVIPKQHAEKYFPLDTSTNEKGLLLNFEDRNGKPWRFRYSYWNSSQSYVMTKGWSRFVKEKKLDAGDIVSFQRGIGDLGKDRLFIDWRRRPDGQPDQFPSHQFSFNRSIHPWNPLFLQPPPTLSREYSHFLSGHGPYPYNNTTVVNGNPCPPGSILYVRSAVGVGGGGGGAQQLGMMENQRRSEMVYESVPVVKGGKAASAKRLRLFGVNMDCPVSDSDEHMLSQHSTVPFEQLTQPQSSSSCLSPTILQLRPYNQNEDKGKGSMSLDLDI